MNTLEIAWLAGIIEGEGCFISVLGKNPNFRIQVKMTDKDIIDRIQKITNLGSTNVEVMKNPRYKTCYHWKICIQSDVAALMMTIYPFMGERRRARIKLLLKEWRAYPISSQRPCIHGHGLEYMRPSSKGSRECGECRRITDKKQRERIATEKMLGYR